MTKLYASHNSEFFAVREPGRLYLYRDSFLDMTHRIADHLAGDLIHLADSGECFFRAKDGLFRMRREKGVRAERCQAVAGLDGSVEGGVLKGFAVRADGEQIAFEQVVPAQKFSSKLKRFLGQKSSQGDIGPSLHRFIVSSWSGRSSSCYFETVIDPRVSAGVVWWASADFGFLAVLERERDGRSTLRLIDILDESVVNELVVDGKLSRDRFLTTNGTIGFGLEKNDRRAFLLWTYSQDRYQVAYPKNSRVLHLSKDRVIFLNRAEHYLTVKTFDNKVEAEVSLTALARLGVEYLINFNPRGSLELVTYHNQKMRVHHTDIEQLPTDARRWELAGERQRAESAEQRAEEILERGAENREQQHWTSQRQQLEQDVMATGRGDYPTTPGAPEVIELETFTPAARPPGNEPAPVEEVAVPVFESSQEAREALDRLRLSYVAGELTREAYFQQKSALERAVAGFSEETRRPEGPGSALPPKLSLSVDETGR